MNYKNHLTKASFFAILMVLSYRKGTFTWGCGMQRMNRKGVTLVELVIVMCIIAIGALLISPNFGKWVSHYRLRTATRDIVSTLRVAQMKAVSNNMEYQVSFPNTTSFVLQFRTTIGVGSFTPDGPPQSVPSGITIPSFFTAQFNPNASSTAGTIRLQNSTGTSKRSITVAPTGRITIGE